MDINDLKNFDCTDAIQRLQAASDEMRNQMASEITSGIEYKAMLENSIFQTRDTLLEMQEASKKDAVLQTKRFIIQAVLSVASLIAAVVAAVAAIIALL